MRPTTLIALLSFVAIPAFAGFAIDLPIVTHVNGATTTFYTSIDVTNNTSQSTDATFEYISSDLAVDAVGSFPTLGSHGNFHTDDILTYLGAQGFITPAQAASGFGTLLITFTNTSFTTGSEASATVRVYNYLTAGQRPSVGLAYRGIVLRLNGSHTLSSIVGNTINVTDGTPAVSTNLGLENVGIDDSGAVTSGPVTLQLTFYDPRTGGAVGTPGTVTLQPGQVTQINNVWNSYSLPADATQIQVTVTETSGTAQIRGYVVLKDVSTNDGSFFFMQ